MYKQEELTLRQKVLIGALRAGFLTWLEFLEEWRKS